jgi:hypothetical protein
VIGAAEAEDLVADFEVGDGWVESGDGAGYVGAENEGEAVAEEEAEVAAVGVVGEDLGLLGGFGILRDQRGRGWEGKGTYALLSLPLLEFDLP